MTPEDGNELVAALRKGSADAVATVRARVRRILRSRAYRMPRADRQELEQEIVIQVWQAVNRTSFDPNRGFWGFVEVVSARRSIDWLRTRKRESAVESELQESAGGPLADTLARERAQLAYAALAQLARPCRDLIYLRIGMGRSYREIGRLLDRSEGALRVQMHRCVNEARRILGELGSSSRKGESKG